MQHIAHQEITDRELVERFTSSNDVAHFDALVRRHIARVRSMVVSMVINDADADDVTQDVFLHALRGLPGFKKKAKFSTWLHTITMNTTRTFLKKRSRDLARFGGADRKDIEAVADPAEPHARSELDAAVENPKKAGKRKVKPVKAKPVEVKPVEIDRVVTKHKDPTGKNVEWLIYQDKFVARREGDSLVNFTDFLDTRETEKISVNGLSEKPHANRWWYSHDN